jgi:hypothetical protein
VITNASDDLAPGRVGVSYATGADALRVDHDHFVLIGGGREAGVELRVHDRQSSAEAGRRGRHLEKVIRDDFRT